MNSTPQNPRGALQPLPETAPSPADNLGTAPKVELGRRPFRDPILPRHQDVARTTCHQPDFGYADGLALSIGVGGLGLGPGRVRDPDVALVPRNAPTVSSTGFNGWVDDTAPPDPSEAPMFGDNRDESLEAQALGPIRSDVEMRGDAYPEDEAVQRVVERLAAVRTYVTVFADACEKPSSEAVSEQNLFKAIAALERPLSRPNRAHTLRCDGNGIEVVDTGPGIEGDTLARITEPYVRGPGDGRGLGLAIANGLYARLGRGFEVHSVVGNGIKARVELRGDATAFDALPFSDAEPVERASEGPVG